MKRKKKKKSACSPEEEAARQEASGEEQDEPTLHDDPGNGGEAGDGGLPFVPGVVSPNAGNPLTPHVAGPTDAELILRAQQGEPGAFSAVEQHYRRIIIAIIRTFFRHREDVEDLLQETFLKLFESLDTIDPWGSPGAYVRRIATSTCIDELRKRARRPRVVPFQGSGNDADDDGLALESLLRYLYPDPQEQLERKALHAAVRAALGHLTEKEAAAIWLFYGEERSWGEVLVNLGFLEERYENKDYQRERRFIVKKLGTLRTHLREYEYELALDQEEIAHPQESGDEGDEVIQPDEPD